MWSGNNWTTKTDLGALKNDILGGSTIFALSADGKVAAGISESEIPFQRAVIWSGDNWATKTDLGTLRNDNLGDSTASVLSADGKVVAGTSRSDEFSKRATIWSGDNWATKTDLGTLRNDNSGDSIATALSADGTIAAGMSEIDTVTKEVYRQATIWSGKNWEKTSLGSLRSDNLGNSQVTRLSADGKIAAGYSDTDSKTIQHAVIWSGENWATKTDLGTFKADNSGVSSIHGLSADGTIAVGFSSTDAKGQRAVLWKIVYPASSESGSNSKNPAHIQFPMQPTQ
ncbi:hypothetical protein C5H23_08420 [Xylella fastidiosa]|nr:hypothetical protein C5H23_08420 [Xylella fastidiosa]TNV99642.1 hypothetical protein C5H21_03560 [Xylella fastidiosa]